MFGGGKLWRISHQELLASKTLTNYCLFTLFMSQDIVIIWTVKFDKPPPVIHQFCHGFPLPKLRTIRYVHAYDVCMYMCMVIPKAINH